MPLGALNREFTIVEKPGSEWSSDANPFLGFEGIWPGWAPVPGSITYDFTVAQNIFPDTIFKTLTISVNY